MIATDGVYKVIMDRLFDTTAQDIIEMTWDEVDELMGMMIRNGFYKEFVDYLGKPPHVIKHDYFIEEMNKKKEKSKETTYVNTGHGIPL